MSKNALVERDLFLLSLEDGSANEVSVWSQSSDTEKVYLMLPAMGVRASYYDRFCLELASSGDIVASVDWRGHDKSSIRASRRNNWGYSRLIEEVQYYCNWLKKKYSCKQVYLIGHSMGGQVGHLAAARYPNLIQGVYTIASSDPYFNSWKGIQKVGIYLAASLVRPISFFVGHFPGYFFGFGKRESRMAIRDWAYAVRRGTFKPRKDSFDYPVAKKIYPGRIISISIANDFFAPKAAVDFTLAKFEQASVNTHFHLVPIKNEETTLDHFNWVKYSERVLNHIVDS